ncbi:hypothetical protein SBF1_750023 [Candidatus Desulfosporosinus infrequens]|uniref:Uncharacterized protein n=1 Tax=Candidatus Desulfosporosinus infrequens TaxID=2043169 RepID=A0A2U3LR94_9FIRM|nr:hypothetical protein SBF1_750023 [Candidatus Desulfosporosinus infrequens]
MYLHSGLRYYCAVMSTPLFMGLGEDFFGKDIFHRKDGIDYGWLCYGWERLR